MSVLRSSEYNLDLYIPPKRKDWFFFFACEKGGIEFYLWEQWKFNEYERKGCEAAQPQHHMPIEKFELHWLSFLKLEPWDTFQTNATVAALFVKVFGWKM